MQDLTPVGLNKDGTRLVLVSASGEEYAVPVDQRLRSALRGDARLGQLEMKMESALRPRDIQARIRAGESPETVAAAAQTTVEAIMGFATPVLAERAHVAQLALKASVRRRSAESSHAARTLGDATRVLLGDLGLHEQDVSWDAWRREDGRWVLVADYLAGGKTRHATFTYDMPGRYVVADDDEARLLTGETKATVASAPRTGQRRLSAVVSQDELPLGDDAIEMVREPVPTEPVATKTQAAPEAAAHEEPPQVARPAVVTPQDEGAEPVDGAAPVEEPTDTYASEQSESEESDPEEGRPARKKGRSSVPSWDEIMFGGGPTE